MGISIHEFPVYSPNAYIAAKTIPHAIDRAEIFCKAAAVALVSSARRNISAANHQQLQAITNAAATSINGENVIPIANNGIPVIKPTTIRRSCQVGLDCMMELAMIGNANAA